MFWKPSTVGRLDIQKLVKLKKHMYAGRRKRRSESAAASCKRREEETLHSQWSAGLRQQPDAVKVDPLNKPRAKDMKYRRSRLNRFEWTDSVKQAAWCTNNTQALLLYIFWQLLTSSLLPVDLSSDFFVLCSSLESKRKWVSDQEKAEDASGSVVNVVKPDALKHVRLCGCVGVCQGGVSWSLSLLAQQHVQHRLFYRWIISCITQTTAMSTNTRFSCFWENSLDFFDSTFYFPRTSGRIVLSPLRTDGGL